MTGDRTGDPNPAGTEVPPGEPPKDRAEEADGTPQGSAEGAPEAATPEADTPSAGGGGGRRRTIAARAVTTLAFLLVLLALVAPNRLGRLTPEAFVRIPLEALVGVALVLVLPAWGRRVVVVLSGAAIGLLVIVKLFDMGFFAVLDRQFDPVFDSSFFRPAMDVLTESVGRAGAIGAVIAAVVLAVAVLVLMTLSVRRLTRLAARHQGRSIRAVAVLGVVWVACAALGAQLVPGMPIAARDFGRLRLLGTGLQDQRAFAAETAVDDFRDTPAGELLTSLRGKDVIVAFVESYGRDAIEDPRYAPQVGAVLDDGTRRLRAAGFGSRSAFLTSPTSGAGSWLSHSTLLSGVWIDNQRRYRNLVTSDRLTLNGAFRRAGWRTVGVMPGVTREWPEAEFFDFDHIYNRWNMGYRGPRFSLVGGQPDQYTLAAFERYERDNKDRAPVMAEIPLVSSHSPWTPIPRLLDWDDLGDGTVFGPIAKAGAKPKAVWRDPARVRTAYRRSIEYTLSTLVSYVQTHGDDDLVVVFVGDHQPAPLVTGGGAGRDVPITIVAKDRAVVDRVSGWGWHDGLKPGPKAPVWRMNTFRDRFLTAFGSRAHPRR